MLMDLGVVAQLENLLLLAMPVVFVIMAVRVVFPIGSMVLSAFMALCIGRNLRFWVNHLSRFMLLPTGLCVGDFL